jgi:hypothetical protein
LRPAELGEFLFFMMYRQFSAAQEAATTIGKYRIAALPARLGVGQFCARVSIASGQGQASTDRVMRFTPVFQSHDAAAQYALEQGIGWAHSAIGSP